jgi:hypothetical protein
MAGEFDILALRLRAAEWRDEAERVPAGPMREFCLREACRYERRLRASANTPIIHERGIGSGWSAKGLNNIDPPFIGGSLKATEHRSHERHFSQEVRPSNRRKDSRSCSNPHRRRALSASVPPDRPTS